MAEDVRAEMELEPVDGGPPRSEVLGSRVVHQQVDPVVLCPIDRWGHLPHAQAMTPQSVSTLVRAHLSGSAPIRTTLPVRAPDNSDVTDLQVEPDIVLDQSYYERGTAARRRDYKDLEDLADAFA
ncbi:hypothetical protein [Rhodococcus sp. RDE2]|uniref:hypothetical protein n=1 Tax=Rhodococcus sp. RDE2 TaxID=2885078 RepID=UPI003B63A6B5